MEQEQPDPDFPTVVFPNPEEGKGTWQLAFSTGGGGYAGIHCYSCVLMLFKPMLSLMLLVQRYDSLIYYI